MSHTRMTTLAFFFQFWSYLPFLCLNLISCLCSVTRIPYGIFLMMLGTNVEQDENDNSGGIMGGGGGGGGGHLLLFFFSIKPFLVLA